MNRLSAAALLCGVLWNARVWACAVCFGAPDDPQTKGMNAAILTLMGITYALFLGMIAAAFVLWRKSRGSEAAGSSPNAIAPELGQHHG